MEKKLALKIVKQFVRWGIAVVGIWWVISQMSWHDHVWAFLPGRSMPQKNLTVTDENAPEDSAIYHVIDPQTGKTVSISAGDVVNEPDRPNLKVFGNGHVKYVVAVDLSADLKQVRGLWVADQPNGPTAAWALPSEYPAYQITVPHPRLQIGVLRMVRHADIRFIIAALAIFPVTILITSLRWHELLRALDIRLRLGRTFVLNMVGMFYNTIMPTGSTGGDVFKAYYVARQTHHRTRAVMSVAVDRVIGLAALIILGGAMAALQQHIPRCRQVALASAGILIVATLAILVFYVPSLRELSGLDFIIKKLPMQKQVRGAVETLHIYGHRPLLVLVALFVSFPVHMIVITAAQLCGIAFGLHLNLFYYWMAVPVIVLASAIPISPQGAGVMEYFAIKLLQPQGVTVAQAFALTMSIRLVQILWNLTGGFFVLRGGYHAPTQTEQKLSEEEDEDQSP
ncbi:MAG: lysylphosphatidylglycerol synthase transmembrane domain-containing protein [Tepidisphaeraceae bacterium]